MGVLVAFVGFSTGGLSADDALRGVRGLLGAGGDLRLRPAVDGCAAATSSAAIASACGFSKGVAEGR